MKIRYRNIHEVSRVGIIAMSRKSRANYFN
nr:MAG TPA: hypothetical protein [Caudoviricetes sp.]